MKTSEVAANEVGDELKLVGYWTGLGTDADTGQPITMSEWVDRLAPRAGAANALMDHGESELHLDPLPLLTQGAESGKIVIAHIATAGRADPSISP